MYPEKGIAPGPDVSAGNCDHACLESQKFQIKYRTLLAVRLFSKNQISSHYCVETFITLMKRAPTLGLLFLSTKLARETISFTKLTRYFFATRRNRMRKISFSTLDSSSTCQNEENTLCIVLLGFMAKTAAVSAQ